MSTRILRGDCRDVLRTLPDASVHCCVTSPPYWNLRDYGVAGQIGLEQTPTEYVTEIVAVFREVRRVLRDDATVFLNLGDCYSAGGNGPGSGKQLTNVGAAMPSKKPPVGLKPKDLVGIPWMVAFALRDDGWYLRQDNIWAKRNCMPESVRDRTTRAHEYMFMLTKSPHYYYDATAIEEEGEIAAGTKAAKGSAERAKHANGRPPEYAVYTGKRNKRSVWWLTTEPYPGAHFAVMPTTLVEPCILAGTSERGCCPACGAPWMRQQTRVAPDGRSVTVPANQRQAAKDGTPLMGDSRIDVGVRAAFNADRGLVGKVEAGWLPSCTCDAGNPVPAVVLDPFGGAGTVALVADRHRRDAILIDLNPAYAELQIKRIQDDAGMFASVTP